MDIAQVLESGEIKIEKTEETVDVEYDWKENMPRVACRGCLAACNLMSMTHTYYHDGKPENYSDMLLFCFRLKLEELVGSNNTMHTFICEECIKKLRNATEFRNQLETAKNNFECFEQKPFENDDIKSSEKVLNYESSNDNTDNQFEEKESNPDFILDVKKISQFSVKRIRKKSVIKNSLQKIVDKQKKRLSEVSKRDQKSEKSPWTKERMKSAAQDVFSEKLSPEEAEIEYGISQAAIVEKVALMKAGRRVDFSPKRGRFKNTFTEEYEDRLVKEIAASLKKSRPLSRSEFLQIARHLARSLKIDHKFHIETESAGRNFYYYFMKRYPALNQKSQKRLLVNGINEPNKSDEIIEGPLSFLNIENVIKKRRKKKIKLLDIINDTDVKCKICGEEFLWNKNLKMHMSVHYPNHVCETCGHLSATRGQLYQHSYTHSKTLWQCKLCPDKKYKTLTALQAHTKVKHLGETHAYKCPECDERFKSFPRRRRHLVEMHNHQDKKYACKLCEKEFEAAGTLSTHVRIVHLKERNHACSQCDRSFFSKKFLEDHMLSHSSERNFPCRYCEKRFKRKFTLTEHEKIHTGEKRHVCNLCGKAFTQKASLKGHMAVHDHGCKIAAKD